MSEHFGTDITDVGLYSTVYPLVALQALGFLKVHTTNVTHVKFLLDMIQIEFFQKPSMTKYFTQMLHM